MKLSDIKGVNAIEVLADLLIPFSRIAQDPEVVTAFRDDDTPKIKLVELLLKKHPQEILEVFAIIEGVPVEQYQPTLIELPMKLLDFLNDPDVQSLFLSQEQNSEVTSSIPAMATITAIDNQ
jgi:hypothetical protein